MTRSLPWRLTLTDFIQTESMEEANRMKYPLHLAGTALQLFQLAAVRGLGKESDVSIFRVWEGVDGPVFPVKG